MAKYHVMANLFGTDGIRGLAGQYPLDENGAIRIGLAIGKYFGGQQIVIGRDPRESSTPLANSVAKGIKQTGVNVIHAGVLPTPGLAYITREGPYSAGIMITASHNPYTYNGVKVFDRNGDKLGKAAEAELNQLIGDNLQLDGEGKEQTDDSLIKTYEDFLVNSAGDIDLSGLRLAVDSANGAASGLAQRVLIRLKAQVTPLFDSPNGTNINAKCGATDPSLLQQTVKDNKLDMGIALDGDADRVLLVDEQGTVIKGDHILYILAITFKASGVVATVMSNLGLQKALEAKGIHLVRVNVGDHNVLDGLKEHGYTVGGEESGHIVLPHLLATGDGLLAAVQTLKAIKSSGKSLSQWASEFTLVPQALVNVPLKDKSLLQSKEAQEIIDKATNRLGGQGRLLIRPSGTEPLCRVMVEADNAQSLASDIAKELEAVVS